MKIFATLALFAMVTMFIEVKASYVPRTENQGCLFYNLATNKQCNCADGLTCCSTQKTAPKGQLMDGQAVPGVDDKNTCSFTFGITSSPGICSGTEYCCSESIDAQVGDVISGTCVAQDNPYAVCVR
ncbi:hypothetical protein BCV70DRAFT_217201 [Testicularia cyperi]|uniref:Hydrophobin n=1 Tax=Testicularia cyperi TaxID=1882483 RepID=A0A317XQN7_9BASI|nr:hypothetical protein BCV70DRAFT_217201 [Testicularia cyperi]